MSSYPLVCQLPPLVTTAGWQWQKFEPASTGANFWIGTDTDGNRWLTKLRGSFCAYREIIFSRLAQSMKWSYQSSVFMQIDDESAITLGVGAGEIHAAQWFLHEHAQAVCAPSCPMQHLHDAEIRRVAEIAKYDIAHLLDWPKTELAAYIFGASDHPDRLITVCHEFVAIDGEQMFAHSPSDPRRSSWCVDQFGEKLQDGLSLLEDVCADLVALTDSQLEDSLRVPPGIHLIEKWPIAPLVERSFVFARNVGSSARV